MRGLKAKRLAYLFWFLLGAFGSHRFYLGQRKAGHLILAYTVITTGLSLLFYDQSEFFYSGTFDLITGVPFWIFILSDGFRIPKWVKEINAEEQASNILE